jgi:hypothetical protein
MASPRSPNLLLAALPLADYELLAWGEKCGFHIASKACPLKFGNVREQEAAPAAGRALPSRRTCSAPAASIVHPGKVDFRRIVWEREP